jgi:hypothetical protein
MDIDVELFENYHDTVDGNDDVEDDMNVDVNEDDDKDDEDDESDDGGESFRNNAKLFLPFARTGFGCVRSILVGGPQEKKPFFQIASGPILSIPTHSNSSQYDPCKVSLKKMTPSLPVNTSKSAFFWY